jgi:TP901 family phage tail tape measure protein
MANGIELATEWVTILPETAMLVKKLKEFRPPPISVGLKISSPRELQNAIVKPSQQAGLQAGKAAGAGISQGVVTAAPQVQQAASRLGDTIRKQVVDAGGKAGEDSTKAMAQGIEKQKAAVARAERSVADARRNEANVDSRIRAQEEKIQQYRSRTAQLAQAAADAEARANQMRADSEEHTAEQIARQEAKVEALRQRHAAMMGRLAAAEESQGRLVNTRESAANRTAGALDRMSIAEAGLATAVSQANSPLEESVGHADRAGGAFGRMTGALIPLGRQMLITTGLFTGALGLGGAITSVLRQGNQFQESMNIIQGVTQASGEQMAAMSNRAKELGRDMTLPATSAADAADAMLELVRAGFTVQQAMDAVKGSLQLSAAAGVSATEAAKVTGTTLNAFALNAGDAARVTDILANAANMFPGEMQDFAYSLSQGGAIAHTFGVSIEDTTTALGFLAQAGIKSSDAGTLIKTMLLSLTDQGKPAQQAIKQLGLELYDAQGHFRGLDYVFKKLSQDSKTMTQEAYQAATGTLFGTDAARFAGVAANHSAEDWDRFRAMINKTGTAADVAEKRMQGLPGAMKKLKNAGEDLALTIYGAIAPSLEKVVSWVAKTVEAFTAWLRDGGLAQFFKEHKDLIIGIAAGLGTYVTVLSAVKTATAAWTAVQWALNAAMDANPVSLVIIAIAALVAGVIYAYKHFKGFRDVVDNVGRAIKKAWQDEGFQKFLKNLGAGLKDVWQNVLVPFGHFLGSAFQEWLKFAGFMWQNVWLPVLKVVGAALSEFWHNIAAPFIGWIAENWPAISTVIKAAFQAAKQEFDIIKDVVLFLWHNVWEPAWTGISAAFKIAWTAIQVAWAIGKAIFDEIVQIIQTLWHTIWEPAWQAIAAAVQFAWEVISTVFNFFKAGLDLIGQGALALWHTIFEPMWEGIKAGWQVVWDFLKPLFDQIGAGIKTIGDIGSNIAKGIKDAWSGVFDILKAPLHGLGNVLAGIPDEILGVHIDFAGDLRNWGKALQSLATGGTAGMDRNNVLYGPGTGTSDSILGLDPLTGMPTARVSAGEGVVPKKVMDTPLGMALFQQLLSMAQGFQGGGIPTFGPGWDPDTQINFDGNIVNKPKTPLDWMYLYRYLKTLKTFRYADQLEDPTLPIDPTVSPGAITSSVGIGNDFGRVPGLMEALGLGRKRGGIIPRYDQGGQVGLTRDMLDKIAVEKFGLTLGSGDRNEPGSHHNIPGGARDYNGPPDKLERFAQWLASGPLKGFIDQEIFQAPSGKKYGIAGGKPVGPDLPGTTDPGYYSRGHNDWADHTDHVHVGFGAVSRAFKGGIDTRHRQRSGMANSMPDLTPQSGREDVARRIMGEAAKRGFSREQTIAVLSTGLQESGLSPTAQGGGGAWHGVFQQDKSYPGRDDPNQNISAFFDRLGTPKGDAWEQIFGLQQGKAYWTANSRKGYMDEIKSKSSEASSLYDQLAGSVGDMNDSIDGLPGGDNATNPGNYVVDPKKVREAQDRVDDRQNQFDVATKRLNEFLAKQAAGDKVKQSTIDEAKNQVDKFGRELEEAKSDLETAKQGTYKPDKSSGRGSKEKDGLTGGGDWQDVGKMIFGGMLEEIGLDGSFLKNPFEMPNVKSGMALANFGLGLLFPDKSGGGGAGGSGLDAGLGLGDPLDAAGGIIAGIGDPMGLNSFPAGPDQQGAGQAGNGGGGPNFDLRGANLGVTPADFEDKIDGMTAAARRYPTLATTV